MKIERVVFLTYRHDLAILLAMKIPNANRAVADINKLREYSLNFEHDDGKHKAQLFLTKLGLTLNDAEILQNILLEIVKTHEAELSKADIYGQRYRLDFVLEWAGKRAILRSAWIVRYNEDFPRLVSCYPLK